MSNKKLRDLMSGLEAGGVTEYRVSQGSVPAFVIDEINISLRDVRHTQIPADFDRSWVVDEGELRGKFPKRVAQYIRKYGQEDETVGATLLSHIGNIAKQSAPPDEFVYVDVTSDLNWNASDYGDAGSCYWGCKRSARFALMEADCYALRFYDKVKAVPLTEPLDERHLNMDVNGDFYREFQSKNYLVTPSAKFRKEARRQRTRTNNGLNIQNMPGRLVMQDNQFFCGVGRAWIIPGVPEVDDAIVFNLYHMFSEYRLVHAAHILSEMLGFGGVKLVEYVNNDTAEGDLHINSASGALVTSLEKLRVGWSKRKYRTVRTHIDCSEYWQCAICHKIEKSDIDLHAKYIGYDVVCPKCYKDNCVACKNCDTMKPATEISLTYAFRRTSTGRYEAYVTGEVCTYCNNDKDSPIVCRGHNTANTDEVSERRSCGVRLIARSYAEHTKDVLVYQLRSRLMSVALCPICAADSVALNYCALCARRSADDYSSHSWRTNKYVMDGVEFCMCDACSRGYSTIREYIGTRLFYTDFEEHPDAFGLVEASIHGSRVPEPDWLGGSSQSNLTTDAPYNFTRLERDIRLNEIRQRLENWTADEVNNEQD